MSSASLTLAGRDRQAIESDRSSTTAVCIDDRKEIRSLKLLVPIGNSFAQTFKVKTFKSAGRDGKQTETAGVQFEIRMARRTDDERTCHETHSSAVT